MSTDRTHLTAASAAILSLSMVMWATAPAAAETAGRASLSASPEQRSLPRQQRQAMVLLMGRLAEAARDLCPPKAQPSARLAHGGPQLPIRGMISRRWMPAPQRDGAPQPAMPLSHLNLPPPAACQGLAENLTPSEPRP